MGGDLYSTVNSGADGIYYELVSGPQHGSINLYGNGEFDFHAVPGFSGSSHFEYSATDEYGNSTTHTVAHQG